MPPAQNDEDTSDEVGKKRPRQEASSSSSSEDDEEQVAAPQPKRKSRSNSKASKKQAPPQKYGEYTLKYQDDKSGSKYIHPTAVRFTLHAVEDLARDTIASVSKSLKDDGEQVRYKYWKKQSFFIR